MKLLILDSNAWDLVAEQVGDECGLVEWLDQLGDHYQASVNGLFALFERAVLYGPSELGDKLCHCIDEDQKLYEFIKGDIRVIWFYGKNRIVCCSHGLIKKRQKTPKTEKDRALRFKERYELALQQSAVSFVTLNTGD